MFSHQTRSIGSLLRKILGPACLVLFSNNVFCQTNIAVLDFRCSGNQVGLRDMLLSQASGGGQEECQLLRSTVMDALYTDTRVLLVDRSELAAIAAERDLQKDEDFLEGYVVDQWKAQGAEYLLSGQVSARNQTMTLMLHSISDQSVAAREHFSYKVGILGSEAEKKALILQGLQRLLADFFQPEILLLKVLKGSAKSARSILIAGGTHHGLRTHLQLAVKATTTEMVDGQSMERKVTIAQVVVEEVENENFSRCRVIQGGKAIMTALSANQSLSLELSL